jgi:hypothetical protein
MEEIGIDRVSSPNLTNINSTEILGESLYQLSHAEIDDFIENGYVILRNAFDSDLAAGKFS